jgi:hypothetical protein
VVRESRWARQHVLLVLTSVVAACHGDKMIASPPPPRPAIVLSDTSIRLDALQYGDSLFVSIGVSNAAATPLSIRVDSIMYDQTGLDLPYGWLQADVVTSGATATTLRFTVSLEYLRFQQGGRSGFGSAYVQSSLRPGTYGATVVVSSDTRGVTNSPRRIPVTLNVAPPTPASRQPLELSSASVVIADSSTCFATAHMTLWNGGQKTVWEIRTDSITAATGQPRGWLQGPLPPFPNADGFHNGQNNLLAGASVGANFYPNGLPRGRYDATVWMSAGNSRGSASGTVTVDVQTDGCANR